MSTSFRVDYVEAALIALFTANLATAYGAPVDIQSLGTKDFDSDGRLVLQPPSLRIRFAGASFDPLRDNQRLTYEAKFAFDILCFQTSRRSLSDARLQTLQLVAVVQDQLAGTRMQLEDSSWTLPITLRAVELVEAPELPVDQLFNVPILIEGPSQFSGVNANFGGGGT